MTPAQQPGILRFALPKGRMQDNVLRLLDDAGVKVRLGQREYRPTISLPGFETKFLKPQNIVEMLDTGSRDLGFAGADWVAELGAGVVELLDTGLDPVHLVAAGPTGLLVNGQLPVQELLVASEYESLTRQWIARNGLNARFVRSFGATEVFPPEDADLIVDNSATGSTLVANGLTIVDTLMTSSTRLYAHPRALEDGAKRERIDHLVLLLKSVLEARRRVMLEVNVTRDNLEQVVAVLPCMREPTIASLHGDTGFAVKAAVPRADLPTLIPAIKQAGGTDIVISQTTQIVP
ncbi:MAG: ATP phosphoribosyltransferase [Phycisphaeraceae bacterium]|nr:ATP phosphoribosyltransferase [Phycisphaerales bacterium]QOJ18709.1 MAG: ATP phosphoribosyltransferase [Phycisphaeraceae bacterium]